MTAVEYLKKSRRHLIGWMLPCVGFGVGSMILSEGLLTSMLAPPTAILILFAVGSSLLERRLKRRHPEMANLDKWVALMGSAESYPVNDAGRMAQAPMAWTILETYARSANAAIAARSQIEAMLANYAAGSPEALVLAVIHKQLSEIASDSMKAYNARWDLLVGKFRLLPGWSVFDARKFRESFLKQD
jgi:hypothetical protein